jgi:hypothetical protein
MDVENLFLPQFLSSFDNHRLINYNNMSITMNIPDNKVSSCYAGRGKFKLVTSYYYHHHKSDCWVLIK